MFKPGKFTAISAAVVAVVGLSAGSAAANAGTASTGGSTASSVLPRSVLHSLRPDIRLPTAGQPGTNSAGIPIQYSGNWSGYLALQKTNHARAFRYVQANYSVPSVNCTTTPYAFAYQWVGLDGDSDGTVEQDGVGSYCINGSTDYFAWAEMYPAPVQEEFLVNPGDAVTSSVFYDSSTGVYELDLTDLTSGQTFAVNDTCATAGTCDNSSAEVITEGYPSAPYDGTSDFGNEQYNNIRVTDRSGQRGGLINSNWTTAESIAQQSDGDTTEPGALYSAASPSSPALSGFDVQWLREA